MGGWAAVQADAQADGRTDKHSSFPERTRVQAKDALAGCHRQFKLTQPFWKTFRQEK